MIMHSGKEKTITRKLLSKCTKFQEKFKNKVITSETFGTHLAKQSHLHLESQNITSIPSKEEDPTLSLCHALETLYLHDNKLTGVENLPVFYKLRSLYLQSNHITSTRCLGAIPLPSLQKLYIGYNQLNRLEGLSNNPLSRSLRELRMNNQHSSHPLIFEEESMSALGPHLKLLEASNNRVSDIGPLSSLQRLEHLNLKDNNITSLKAVMDMCENLLSLRELDLRGNPVIKSKKYRERIILSSYTLQTLDGKDISPMERRSINMLKTKLKLKPRAERRRSSATSTVSSQPQVPYQQRQQQQQQQYTQQNQRMHAQEHAQFLDTQNQNMMNPIQGHQMPQHMSQYKEQHHKQYQQQQQQQQQQQRTLQHRNPLSSVKVNHPSFPSRSVMKIKTSGRGGSGDSAMMGRGGGGRKLSFNQPSFAPSMHNASSQPSSAPPSASSAFPQPSPYAAHLHRFGRNYPHALSLAHRRANTTMQGHKKKIMHDRNASAHETDKQSGIKAQAQYRMQQNQYHQQISHNFFNDAP